MSRTDRRCTRGSTCYLRIKTHAGWPEVERADAEADLVREFHRLRAEGVVYSLELGGAKGSVAEGRWLTWLNPAYGAPVTVKPPVAPIAAARCSPLADHHPRHRQAA